MGSSISSAKNPARMDIISFCLFCRFILETSPQNHYTCKNFRMANSEPTTPINTPTPQNTARMVTAMEP